MISIDRNNGSARMNIELYMLLPAVGIVYRSDYNLSQSLIVVVVSYNK